MTDDQPQPPIGTQPPPPPASVNADGQAWLRQLDWRQFEQLVGAAYRLQGYAVQETSPGADGGIDLILERGAERVFVQCKHWKAWQVGAPVIRELFGLVVANRATRGIVVTSGSYSREAIEFARQSGTELVDGPRLLALIATGNASGPVGISPAGAAVQPVVPTAANFPPPTTGPASPSCPVCLAPMVLHKARKGVHAGSLFWGCSRFPGCRGTREAAPGTALPPTPRELARQRKRRRNLVQALLSLVPVAALLVIAMVWSGVHALGTTPSRFVPSAPKATPGRSGAATMGEQPMDIAIDAAGKRLYTANYVSGDVTVIDAASMSVVDTIDVPGKPIAIAIAGSTLYVADHAGKKISAIDLKTRKTIRTFATGTDPSDLAVDPSAHRLFVAHSGNGKVWTYELGTGRRLSSLNAFSGSSVAVDTKEHKLYAVSGYGMMTVFRTRSLQRVTFGNTIPGGTAFDSDRQRLYVVNYSMLYEYNRITGKSRSIHTDVDGQSVAVDPSARKAYVVDPSANAVEPVSLK